MFTISIHGPYGSDLLTPVDLCGVECLEPRNAQSRATIQSLPTEDASLALLAMRLNESTMAMNRAGIYHQLFHVPAS
jgi:hypothetical protein